MTTALLIIDMQNSFVQKGGALEVANIRNNTKEYKNFVDQLRNKGVLIIYTRHCFDSKDNIIETKLFSAKENESLKKDTQSWQIYEQLQPKESDIIVDKTRYDAFFKTNLQDILTDNKIENVIITGTMTNLCCESTARGAMYRDFDVQFCSDMTYCSEKKVQKQTLENINLYFGTVLDSKQIINNNKH